MISYGLFEVAVSTVLLAHYAVIVAVLGIRVYRNPPQPIFATHPQRFLSVSYNGHERSVHDGRRSTNNLEPPVSSFPSDDR